MFVKGLLRRKHVSWQELAKISIGEVASPEVTEALAMRGIGNVADFLRGEFHKLELELDSIETLSLPEYVIDNLWSAGFRTRGELSACSERELMSRVRVGSHFSLGKRSMEKINRALAEVGLPQIRRRR